MPTELMEQHRIMELRMLIDSLAEQYGQPVAVHVDTIARNFGMGDENSTRDMNTVIHNMDVAFSGFCRGGTHHTGHGDKSRARGSIALPAAVDVEYKITYQQDDSVTVECTKMKDDQKPPPMQFDIRIVSFDFGGQLESSCALDLIAEGKGVKWPKSGPKKLSSQMQDAIDLLHDLSEKNVRVSERKWMLELLSKGIYANEKTAKNGIKRMKPKKVIFGTDGAISAVP
jgi:hypothetical protein